MDDWRLSCTARVAAVTRADIDKSGRNPKIKLHLRLHLESWRAEAPDVELGETVTVGIMERELPREARALLRVDQRVAVEALACGVRPSYARLLKITRLDADA